MHCPQTGVPVGDPCENRQCWFWHPNAKNRCAVRDTGTDHLIEQDVARIYNEDLAQAHLRIDRGRAKIKAWLSVLEMLEAFEAEGCEACGKANCKDEDLCDHRVALAAQIKKQLPVDSVISMNAFKWYSLIKLKKAGHPVFTIKPKGLKPNV